MVIRVLLVLLLLLFLLRSVWRLIAGVIEGATPAVRGGSTERGVAMVRDPVCGTFVVPSRALTSGKGERIQYFCSEECRRRYATR